MYVSAAGGHVTKAVTVVEMLKKEHAVSLCVHVHVCLCVLPVLLGLYITIHR